MAHEEPRRPTFIQRRAMKQLAKSANKRPGEPLSPDDWGAYLDLARERSTRIMHGVLRSIPSTPRCGFCGAPFGGIGAKFLRPLGYRPSRKNPNICDVCVELAPPGGITKHLGVLFADVRGFTALTERTDPHAASELLRRFYGCAEDTLFPEAIIDKVIGDEVMALYIPAYMHPRDPEPHGHAACEAVAPVILAHARALLGAVGYGSSEGPFLEVGIGLDYGEVFVGNVGGGAVKDFTAIGDVVNTASRLTGEARGGEIVLSARLAAGLSERVGEPVTLTLKGKAEPFAGHRVAVI
jgi:adenylate cyclase